MLKTRLSSLLTTTCFAFCGWSFVQAEVTSAITLNYNGRTSNEYSYTLQLNSPDEYLGAGDILSFTNLFGVTSASADAPYTLSFLSDNQVELVVNSTTFGLSNFDISIFSPAAPGPVNYLAEYQDSTFGGLSQSATITGPAVAQAVPFEFSPSLGLFSLLVLFGFKRGWKFLMGNTILPKA